MGAIISKICCCTVKRRRQHTPSPSHPPSNPKTKLSKNPSLIIERTQFLRDEEEGGGSEYSRVLEKDFEIKGRKVVVGKSQFNNEETTVRFNDNLNIKRSDSIIKTFQVKHKESGQLFTLTRIKKLSLSKEASESLCREIRFLAGYLPSHPMLINLYWTWQDENYLYRVDDYGGEDGCFEGENMNRNAFINSNTCMERVASQLALIIHYIHSYGMIHGNINPQSIRLGPDSIKLGYFKYLRRMQGGKRLKGVCGDLEEFRAPECGEAGEGYFEEIDWYSYGKTLEYYSKGLVKSHDLNDLIYNLTRESSRLGYGPAGFKSIQSHSFFANTDWSTLLTQKTDPSDRTKYRSLSASIESLKCRTEDGGRRGGWQEFLEFSWEERGEIGQMLETIIKRI